MAEASDAGAGDVQAKMGEAPRAEPLPPPADLAGCALFLDIDGTLLELAPTPDAVVVPGGLPGVLLALADRAGGALALVTGRSIATADLLFQPVRLPVAGIHGAEIRFPDGTLRQPPPAPGLDDIRIGLRGFVARHPGLLLEDKETALAVHFRAVPEAAAEVEAAVRKLAERDGPGFAVQLGKMVVEVRPAGADKGQAVDLFLQSPPFRGRRPIVLGDDWTDEPAFAVANTHGGRSIRIGEAERVTQAGERMRNPAAVRDWLAGLV
jgi:trehalose 6-phosphate phosphatase